MHRMGPRRRNAVGRGDQNDLPGPDQKDALTEFHPSPTGKTNDDHRTRCPSFSISTMRDSLGEKPGVRDMQGSQDGMPTGGILNGAGQNHKLLVLKTFFSESLNHRRIIQYYQCSVHSCFS